VSFDEQLCAQPMPIQPRSRLAKVGPEQYVSSVTVRSLAGYTREATTRMVGTRRLCRVVYRGQTREYGLNDETISLLTGGERKSSNFGKRFSSWYVDEALSQSFENQFNRNLRQHCTAHTNGGAN
jgi:hypothetical protein